MVGWVIPATEKMFFDVFCMWQNDSKSWKDLRHETGESALVKLGLSWFALPDDQAAAFGSDYFAFESQADLWNMN